MAVGGVRRGEQAPRGRPAGLGVVVPAEDEALVDGKVGLGQGVPVPLEPLAAHEQARRAPDAADPAVPERDEMAGRQEGAAALVAQHDVDRRAREVAIDQDDGQRPAQEVAEDVHPIAGGHVQEPVDLAPGQEVHVDTLPELLALRVAQDHAVVPAEGRGLDAAPELGEVRVRAVREDEAQRVGASPPERAGDGVRVVAELRHRLDHARPDLVRDEARGVDHVRDGGRRYAGASGDLTDGGHESPWEGMKPEAIDCAIGWASLAHPPHVRQEISPKRTSWKPKSRPDPALWRLRPAARQVDRPFASLEQIRPDPARRSGRQASRRRKSRPDPRRIWRSASGHVTRSSARCAPGDSGGGW